MNVLYLLYVPATCKVDGATQEQQVVRVALWHPLWTLLRASVCQLWWMLGLHGVASALGGPQKEVYAELGPMKKWKRAKNPGSTYPSLAKTGPACANNNHPE